MPLLQLLLLLLLIAINGFFVASEFALISLRKTRIEVLVRDGSMRATLIQKALEQLTKYISATQLGITLASLGLGWIAEPFVAQLIEPVLGFFSKNIAETTAHVIGLAIAFVLITYVQILLGELIPKRIALQSTEKTALFVILPLTLFTKIFMPVIFLLNFTSNAMIKLFGGTATRREQNVHSEEEIRILIHQSGKSGLISENEVEMMQNIFRFGDMSVHLVMVPRTEILGFEKTATLNYIVKKIARHPHSRFPVYDRTMDRIIGFFHIKDLYQAVIRGNGGKSIDQTKIIRKILTVPQMKKIDAVFYEMRKKRIHLAIVNDEFGGTAGIVTLEDILESVVGEIEDEFDNPAPEIEKQKDGSYLVDGHTLLVTIQKKFALPIKGQGYVTIGGLVFGLLGREPVVGDTVQISAIVLYVEELNGKQIKTLRVKRQNTRQERTAGK